MSKETINSSNNIVSPEMDIKDAIETIKEEPTIGEKFTYCKKKGRDPESIKNSNDIKHIEYLIDILALSKGIHNLTYPKDVQISKKYTKNDEKILKNILQGKEDERGNAEFYLENFDLANSLVQNPNLSDNQLHMIMFSYITEPQNMGSDFARETYFIAGRISEHPNFGPKTKKLLLNTQTIKSLASGVMKHRYDHRFDRLSIDVRVKVSQHLQSQGNNIHYISPKEYREAKNPNKNRKIDASTDHTEKGNEELFKKMIKELDK